MKKVTKSKKYLLFYFYIIFILFASCKKESIPYYTIPAIVHEWAFYKSGSYWIYINDSTNNDSIPLLDSIFITKSYIHEEKTIRTASDPQYAFEVATINYYSDFNKSTPEIIYAATPNNVTSVDYMDTKLINLGSIVFCILYINNNQQLESHPPELILLNTYSTYNLNGKDYTNVAAVAIKSNGKKFCEFMLSRNNWIIKQVFYFPDGAKS